MKSIKNMLDKSEQLKECIIKICDILGVGENETLDALYDKFEGYDCELDTILNETNRLINESLKINR